MQPEPYTDIALDGEQIPAFLRQQQRWLLWTLTANAAGKPTKKPDQSTTDVKAARTFDAVANVTRSKDGGIGFITTGKIPVPLTDGHHGYLLLFDLDACRDPLTGEVVAEALALIQSLGDTYTEVSPSETGLRVLTAVLNLPDNIKATGRPDWQAPEGVDKKPSIQVFGLGPAGYVTMTGKRLSGTSAFILAVQNIDPQLDRYELRGEAATPQVSITELEGIGPIPTGAEIAARIADLPHGQQLMAADWKAVMPEKSASEAYFQLCTYTLAASCGHGAAALDFLLHVTVWGSGQVDDSRDPSKYARESWVAKELLRAASKRGTPATATEIFDVIPVEPPATTEEKPSAKLDGDPARVVSTIIQEGPLTRLPTGIPSLDALTGGGLILGSRVYLIGAPDAGKTALAVQIADEYLRQNVPVGILGIDEEPVDIVSRLMQRRGISRRDMEARNPATIARVGMLLSAVPLRLFDSETTIEEAAAKLHHFAMSRQPSKDVKQPACVLVVDSVQTARSSLEGENGDSLYKQVTQRVRAIRAAASRYKVLMIVTSEMNRSAYRSKKVDEQTADMAAAKESGAIEFSARVMLSLRNVPGTHDIVEMRVVKNKHGLSHRADQEGIFLKVDRENQKLDETIDFQPVDVEQKRKEQDYEMLAHDAVRLIALLLNEDMGRNAARAALSATVNERRFKEARAYLLEIGAVVETPGPNRSKIMRVQMSRVPPEMKVLLARFMSSGLA